MEYRAEWDDDPCVLCGDGKHWHSTSLRHDCYGRLMAGCECPGFVPIPRMED